MSLLGNFAHLLPGTSRANQSPKSRAPSSRAEEPAEDEDREEMEDEEEQEESAESGEDEDQAEDTGNEDEAEGDEEEPQAASPSGGQRSVAEKAALRQGRRAERARWSGVLSNKAAGHGRLASALTLLSTTDMSETQIIAALKSMPKQSSGSRLDAAMGGVRQPDIGAGGGEKPVNTARAALSASVKAQVDRMTGAAATGRGR